ncbi:interleukin-1 receptor-associated kinase 4-like [Planococcus citri]|uniref:interleukin-1 receptor-associated kinase 4-like n=1 Tax=Planococcus citri TaxID=170843 RepID=UPI0031F8DBAD
MKMTHKNVEIRQLIPGQVEELARILDPHHGWKKLMSCITNDYSSENDSKDYKYTTEDIRLIEEAGQDIQQRSFTEILLSEWGTSGRERPTIRTLHKFLMKAQLIRAADYVSEKILEEPPSKKPEDTTMSEVLNPETISRPKSFGELPTVECDNGGQSGDISDSMQFTVRENHSVEEQFTREEIENLNLVNFDIMKSCTNNFDSSTILGSGGFGTVYFGQLGDKKVAIKKLNIVERDTHLVKQFKNELMMLSQCSHPNILPLVAVSLNEIPCLIYEFMPNGSLDKRLACKLKEFPAMSWQKRVFVASDISNGLKYLHTAFEVPFIHRDIKSANILLDSEDVAKIGDFGLVRKHNSMKTSNTMVFQGTQAYTAPEAFHGTISVKIDIFSYGVVLLELLTGLPAYDPEREGGESLLDHVEEVADEPKDFTELLDKRAGSWHVDIWTDIYNLYKKCKAYKRNDRPDILEVDSTMSRLKEKVSETIG